MHDLAVGCGVVYAVRRSSSGYRRLLLPNPNHDATLLCRIGALGNLTVC